jgi:hypothetical protein
MIRASRPRASSPPTAASSAHRGGQPSPSGSSAATGWPSASSPTCSAVVGRGPPRGRQVGARDERVGREAMDRLLGEPTTCPHGNPIPGSDYVAPQPGRCRVARRQRFTSAASPRSSSSPPACSSSSRSRPLPGGAGPHRCVARRHAHGRDRRSPRRRRLVRQRAHPRDHGVNDRATPPGTASSRADVDRARPSRCPDGADRPARRRSACSTTSTTTFSTTATTAIVDTTVPVGLPGELLPAWWSHRLRSRSGERDDRERGRRGAVLSPDRGALGDRTKAEIGLDGDPSSLPGFQQNVRPRPRRPSSGSARPMRQGGEELRRVTETPVSAPVSTDHLSATEGVGDDDTVEVRLRRRASGSGSLCTMLSRGWSG